MLCSIHRPKRDQPAKSLAGYVFGSFVEGDILSHAICSLVADGRAPGLLQAIAGAFRVVLHPYYSTDWGSRMIARLLLTLALACSLALSGCQGIVIAPWYSPVQDFSLECQGDLDSGECSERLLPGKGSL